MCHRQHFSSHYKLSLFVLAVFSSFFSPHTPLHALLWSILVFHRPLFKASFCLAQWSRWRTVDGEEEPGVMTVYWQTMIEDIRF